MSLHQELNLKKALPLAIAFCGLVLLITVLLLTSPAPQRSNNPKGTYSENRVPEKQKSSTRTIEPIKSPSLTNSTMSTKLTRVTNNIDQIAYANIVLPESLSKWGAYVHIIDGAVYELDDASVIKKTRLEIEGVKNITICLEYYDAYSNRIAQEFYNGENIVIFAPLENQGAILSLLTDAPTEYRYRVIDSKIYVQVPYNRQLDIIEFSEDLNQSLGGIGMASIIKNNF